MKKIILTLILIICAESSFASSIFDNLKVKRASYLEFILLKLENRLVQQAKILEPQATPVRIQYQNVSMGVDYVEEEKRILILIEGTMDKIRYSRKTYKPKNSDCNILRNLLLFKKYGYNIFLGKRNKFLPRDVMIEIFENNFLNNLDLTKKEKKYIIDNTFVKVTIIDPVKGNDVFCSGNVVESVLK